MTSFACWFWGEKTCQSTASLLLMITPPFSWIFTKYANEWPPRKKNRKWSTRKKIRKWSPRKKNRKWSPRKSNRKRSPRKRTPEVARDLWPLTLTRKRTTLTTHFLKEIFQWNLAQSSRTWIDSHYWNNIFKELFRLKWRSKQFFDIAR